MLGVVRPRRRRGRTSSIEAQAYHPADPTPTAESELRSGFPARRIGNVGLGRPTDRIAAFAEVILAGGDPSSRTGPGRYHDGGVVRGRRPG